MKYFITIWQYKINPERKDEFENLYGQSGEWITLFKKYKGYLKTELLKDLNNENTFLTLDYWDSKESFKYFKKNSVKEYSGIDKKGEDLTLSEKHIGEFTIKK
ncbi:MAG: hypothetical protein EHM47_05920 [Ignavibacteriales bacterium]|nr:MAG: hypothetical protein EHM47_05920 [Ignavibacteriales bacterium]